MIKGIRSFAESVSSIHTEVEYKKDEPYLHKTLGWVLNGHPQTFMLLSGEYKLGWLAMPS